MDRKKVFMSEKMESPEQSKQSEQSELQGRFAELGFEVKCASSDENLRVLRELVRVAEQLKSPDQGPDLSKEREKDVRELTQSYQDFVNKPTSENRTRLEEMLQQFKPENIGIYTYNRTIFDSETEYEFQGMKDGMAMVYDQKQKNYVVLPVPWRTYGDDVMRGQIEPLYDLHDFASNRTKIRKFDKFARVEKIGKKKIKIIEKGSVNF